MDSQIAPDEVTTESALEFLEKDFLMPHSLHVEREVIGLMIRDASLRLQAFSLVKDTDFFAASYKNVFNAILVLVERGGDVSALTVSEVMKSRGTLAEIGGYAGLVALTQTETSTPKSLTELAKILRDNTVKREVFVSCRAIAAECFAPEATSDSILQKADVSFSTIANKAETSSTIKSMNEIAQETLLELERWRSGEQTALKTGIPEWDKYLVFGGFSQRDLIYIAARSSYGKTAIVWQIIRNMARAGHPVLFFSAEMDAFKLALRAMQGIAAKYTNDKRGFQFTPHSLRFAEDKEQVYHLAKLCLEELEDLPIYVDDSTRDWSKMKAKARRMRDKGKCEAIFGDYLQLFADDDEPSSKRHRSKAEEVGAVSTGSKHLAKELDVPFTWISQIGRSAPKEKRDPENHDLSWSQQIEYDADVIVLLSGDGPKGEEDRRVVNSRFTKQRNGPVGRMFEMDFETDKQTFFTNGLLELVELEQRYFDSLNQDAAAPIIDRPMVETAQANVVESSKRDRIDDIDF